MSYLDRYKNIKPKKDSRSRQSIRTDKWDRLTADQIRKEVRDYLVAENELNSKVDTGIEAMNDTLFALYKARPELVDKSEIRPSYSINHKVIEELMSMKDYEKNRPIAVGDPIGAGLACAAMEPDLEVLFDKLKKAQEIAENMEQTLQQIESLEATAESMMSDLQDSADGEAKNYQNQIDQINEAIKLLNDSLNNDQNELDQELKNQESGIQQQLKSAMESLTDHADGLAQAETWGLQPGGVRRMSPDARIELSKKLKTEKFKRMADLFGKMQSLALNEQLHRVDYSSEEIYDLEQGADLNRVVPIEMLSLSDDILVYDWLHRFVERSLVQYSLRGQESVAKGGIIILEDGSSSMSGTREIWSKAIGLALLKIAMMQNRPFNAVNFAGPGEFVRWDFDTTHEVLKSVKTYKKSSKNFDGLECVLDYAETALHGGTNFETPLSVALDILQKQHDETGAVQGDIVFLTDGECGISESFVKDFKAEQNRLGFEIFGIAIQTNPKSEPLYTLCDGKVTDLKKLNDVNDMRLLFSEIG